ncbi:hypothetical protein SFC66_05130 [Terribacillus saccharophilus]
MKKPSQRAAGWCKAVRVTSELIWECPGGNAWSAGSRYQPS